MFVRPSALAVRCLRQARYATQAAMTQHTATFKDKQGGILFTPGPLCTSPTVKEQMLVDYGSRDSTFIEAVREMREGLLKVAGVSADEYTAIPMQGSGSMGVEAVVGSSTPPNGKFLILRNGAYGDRMNNIAKRLGIQTVFHNGEEDRPIDLAAVEQLLRSNPDITNVGIVHCETSTGVFNPLKEIRDLMDKYTPNASFFVDAMSSFGGVPIDVKGVKADFLVSSSNKCIQGVPGFSLIIARKEAVKKCEGQARSFCLDIAAQDKGLNASGQFNNTPPVQSIMAFRQALRELEEEGGVEARSSRYRANQKVVVDGLKQMGFTLYLKEDEKSFGYIITSFNYPDHPKWDFGKFYNILKEHGFVIYPGKAASAPCFRIGNIGTIQPSDCEDLVEAVEEAIKTMGVQLK